MDDITSSADPNMVELMEKAFVDDDDMVIVIVGDDKQPEEVEVPEINSIKVEITDAEDTEVKNIIERAAKHGQYIKVDVKVEPTDDNECIDADFNLLNEYAHEEYEEESEPTFKMSTRSLSKQKGLAHKDDKKKPMGQKVVKHVKKADSGKLSYIEKLRKENPEFRKDKKMVEHLCSLMRNTRPPTPPPKFCKAIRSDDGAVFVCEMCDTKSKSITEASRHFQDRHGKFYLFCFACGNRFRTSSALYRHEKRCKSPDSNLVLRARGRYMGRRGRGRPFLTDCKFRHDPARAPPQPPPKEKYYCVQCPATFVRKFQLIAHENSHAGIRPHQCDVCPAAYTSEAALRRHMENHANKQFICDHCKRSFKVKELLKAHLLTHEPRKKFQCSECPRHFSQKNALQHHLNRDHWNLPAACACPVCPKRYPRMNQVRNHMLVKHGLTMITRSMFFQQLPVAMKSISFQEAKVVHESEVKANSAVSFDDIEDIKPKKKPKKTKKDSKIPQTTVGESETVIEDGIFNLDDSNNENEKTVNEILSYIQSSIEPGCKVLRIEDGKLVEVQNADAEIREVLRTGQVKILRKEVS